MPILLHVWRAFYPNWIKPALATHPREQVDSSDFLGIGAALSLIAGRKRKEPFHRLKVTYRVHFQHHYAIRTPILGKIYFPALLFLLKKVYP